MTTEKNQADQKIRRKKKGFFGILKGMGKFTNEDELKSNE